MNIRNKYRSNSSPVSPNFRSSFDESVTDDSSSSDLDDIFTPPSTIDMDALIANVNKNDYNKVKRYSKYQSTYHSVLHRNNSTNTPKKDFKRLSLLHNFNNSSHNNNNNNQPIKIPPKPPTRPPLIIPSINDIIKTHGPSLKVVTQASKEAERFACSRSVSDNSSLSTQLLQPNSDPDNESTTPTASPTLNTSQSISSSPEKPKIKSINDIISEHSHKLSNKQSFSSTYSPSSDEEDPDTADINLEIESASNKITSREEKRHGIYKPYTLNTNTSSTINISNDNNSIKSNKEERKSPQLSTKSSFKNIPPHLFNKSSNSSIKSPVDLKSPPASIRSVISQSRNTNFETDSVKPVDTKSIQSQSQPSEHKIEDEFDNESTPSIASKKWVAQYLRSPRLTRLIRLQRFPHHGLQVSLADLGAKNGNPVLIFLGLGCTRHLIGLYSDLANTLNLRLICIDRWGVGRTDPSSPDRRGLIEWAQVIVEVLDILEIRRVAILAHSAGAPYALALAYAAPNRILEPIQLLAPWIPLSTNSSSTKANTGANWKWLKHVPTGVLKAAQAAEWRLQGWSIGKPPQLKYDGIENKVDDYNIEEFYDDWVGESDGNLDNRPSYSQLNVPNLSTINNNELKQPHVPYRSISTQNINKYNNLSNNSNNIPKRSRKISLNNGPSSTQSHDDSEKPVSLGNSLLAASHSESDKGGGAALDLLLILNRGSKPWGFDYRDVMARVQIYWGEKDDRISYDGVKWMKDEMHSCQLQILPNKGHSLLSEPTVIADILESLAEKYNNRIKDQRKQK